MAKRIMDSHHIIKNLKVTAHNYSFIKNKVSLDETITNINKSEDLIKENFCLFTKKDSILDIINESAVSNRSDTTDYFLESIEVLENQTKISIQKISTLEEDLEIFLQIMLESESGCFIDFDEMKNEIKEVKHQLTKELDVNFVIKEFIQQNLERINQTELELLAICQKHDRLIKKSKKLCIPLSRIHIYYFLIKV
ncbi:hypothetical protein RF11_11864 [Thelohanellus kitauei]|uniref:Uncharacterized protein n=1 Tax=Thelohanellus kitauei TaxID=669202 RepID=A0A0C2JA55_THEKT|nr:hypothetical protein RF11_11864 [Thelohanellus kitauei]